ncbi:hypothetical protein ONZ51_g11974 [Trametes cubensis]|uniref:DUF6532 domain-containing protein n=1 Tax=Trametes cubensis TaxID=1111947 RepID=A0AAD7THG6_9APHY|nr:hypothetical protein ONZ51_g11974 [Trametes cubensis]
MGKRRRLPILLSSSDLGSDAETAGVDRGPGDGTSQSQTRAPRKSKMAAHQAWEPLVPGKSRQKAKSTSRVGNERDMSKGQDAASGPEDDSGAEIRPAKRIKAATLNASSDTSNARLSKTSEHRAPRIDPDATDNEDDQIGDKNKGMSNKESSMLPPRFRKNQASLDDDIHESASAEGESSPSSGDEAAGAEQTDDEDRALESMEASPQALEKLFRDEAVHWVDSDHDHARTGRKRGSDRQRAASITRSPPRSASPDSSRSESDREDAPGHRHDKSKQVHPRRSTIRQLAESVKAKKRSVRHDSETNDDESGAANEPPTKATKRRDNSHARVEGESNKKKEQSKGQNKRAKEIPRIVEDKASKATESSDRNVRRHDTKKTTATSSGPAKTSRGTRKAVTAASDIDDASSSGSESDDSGVDVIPPSHGKLKLGDQHRRNAFPDGNRDHTKIIYRAMLKAAADFGYEDMVKHLRKKDQYSEELARLPAQRISTFRGNVRKLADGQPRTAFGLVFGDTEMGDWLQEGHRYIYPFNYQNKSINNAKAYSPPVFLEMLRFAFFKRPTSFGFKIAPHFVSSLPDKPDEKEIPAPMLALVATALHAAIEDCKHGYTQPRDFSTNDYSGIYVDHIQELTAIRVQGPNQYHVLMHGLWRQISTPLGHRGRSAQPRKSFLNVQAMARE